MFRGYLLVKGRVYSNTKMWKRSFWTWLNDLISIEMENVNTQLMFGSSCFFFVCVWVCEEPPKHAARQSMLFYDISIFLKPMQWFEAPWIGKISKTGWWSLLAQSWQWTTNQFFFLHFFWLAMGISQGEDGPGEQLERGPHRFPARHLCDSVNSSRPKGPSLRWKW